METATASGEREAGTLRRGRTISLFGGDVPVRVLVALAIFVAVFMVVWVGLWAALGSLGMVLGMFAAGVAGAFAVKLYGDRFDDAST
jgi:hypothetical protein